MVPSLITQGYFLEAFTRESAEYQHCFCGPHSIPRADCPNCEKPLLRFLSLDTRDPRLNLSQMPFRELPLLFCWTCNIAQEPFIYQINDDDGVTLLEYGSDGVEEDFPYEGYPDHFPGTVVGLIPLTPREQQMISQLNEGTIDFIEDDEAKPYAAPTHQIGGEPWLVQTGWGCWSIECPKCNREMLFIASIGNDCLLPGGFAGNDFVQVIYSFCPQCHTVGVRQSCD